MEHVQEQTRFCAQEYLASFTYPFVPVEDEVVPKQTKPLLHDRPINIMKKPFPALWEVPWLVGVTSHEGLQQALRKSQLFPTRLCSYFVD
jgi:hypothetical protein